MRAKIRNIKKEMKEVLNREQLEILDKVLKKNLETSEKINKDINYCFKFISAKKVEGCSEKTIKYYKTIIDNVVHAIGREVEEIKTEDIREYLFNYQKESNCSKVTVDNVRRILSSFFTWLEDENYILRNPVRRIKKIKTGKVVRETYTEEVIEKLRDNCVEIRDLAIIDILSSTGMRVGELVKLNIDDINFNERECIVEGKGEKQRKVYFDSRAKLHLENYLKERKDDNKALFVSLLKPYKRLNISGVEIRLKELGKKINIEKVHPHKFRRTLATKAIEKGMPIEQVQHLLGHQKIDTTLQYAMINQSNVKVAHRKYIG